MLAEQRYRLPLQLASSGLWVLTTKVSCGAGIMALMFDDRSSIDPRSCGAMEIRYHGTGRLLVTSDRDIDPLAPGAAEGECYCGDVRVAWAGKGEPARGHRLTFADHTEIERSCHGGVNCLFWGQGAIGLEYAPEGA